MFAYTHLVELRGAVDGFVAGAGFSKSLSFLRYMYSIRAGAIAPREGGSGTKLSLALPDLGYRILRG